MHPLHLSDYLQPPTQGTSHMLDLTKRCNKLTSLHWATNLRLNICHTAVGYFTATIGEGEGHRRYTFTAFFTVVFMLYLFAYFWFPCSNFLLLTNKPHYLSWHSSLQESPSEITHFWASQWTLYCLIYYSFITC